VSGCCRVRDSHSKWLPTFWSRNVDVFVHSLFILRVGLEEATRIGANNINLYEPPLILEQHPPKYNNLPTAVVGDICSHIDDEGIKLTELNGEKPYLKLTTISAR
jgi:hypothetical protein